MDIKPSIANLTWMHGMGHAQAKQMDAWVKKYILSKLSPLKRRHVESCFLSPPFHRASGSYSQSHVESRSNFFFHFTGNQDPTISLLLKTMSRLSNANYRKESKQTKKRDNTFLSCNVIQFNLEVKFSYNIR